MNAATQNEMERLVRVNREQQALLDQIYQYVDDQGLAKLGQSRVNALIETHKRAEADRGALAAHIERYRDVFSGLSEYWNGCEGMAAENAAQNAMDVACDMLEELPETSLARRDLLKQAEVLEEMSDQFEFHERARMVLYWKAQAIRRQAEGGEE